jgi:IS30 family transposase
MAKIETLRLSGASIRRIAKELDLSPTTVARVVKEQAGLAR